MDFMKGKSDAADVEKMTIGVSTEEDVNENEGVKSKRSVKLTYKALAEMVQ